MSRRQEQFSSVLREAVQEVLSRGVNDPRVSGLITVTEVRVAHDFADATILVSVLPAERQSLCIHGLQSAVAYIRREAGKKIQSRKLPRFHIVADDRTKKQAAVIDALLKARAGAEPGDAVASIENPTSQPDVRRPDETGETPR